MNFFEGEKIWRVLSNFWTVTLLLFIIFNFMEKNAYEFMVVPLSILYTGVLAIYVSTKEFDRWYAKHHERHPGEWFVLIWTIAIASLMFLWLVWGEEYKLPSDIVAVYIMVLSLFVLTQKSKNLYQTKKLEQEHGKKEAPSVEDTE